MHRKGFPESYDLRRLIGFAANLKSGRSPLHAPVYSHLRYDVVPGAIQTVTSPDIVILEGLNVLQTGAGRADASLRKNRQVSVRLMQDVEL